MSPADGVFVAMLTLSFVGMITLHRKRRTEFLRDFEKELEEE